jgi:hypothetical protein
MLSHNLRRSTSQLAGLPTLEFVASAATDTSSITIPAETEVGDFIVFFDAAASSSTIPTNSVPSGFTSQITTTLNAATDFRSTISVKIAESGDAGNSISGMSCDFPRKIVAVFRASQEIATFTSNNLSGQGTTGTPIPQTKTGYSESDLPILVLAFYRSSAVMDSNAKITVNGSTTSDVDVDTSDVRARLSYLFFNDASIYDAVVSMNDYAAQVMQSFYVTFTF